MEKECIQTRIKGLVSIIVPVYNAENYLQHCIESIIQQSYIKIELILIDDGSTDHSPQICEEMQKSDNRIKVIHCENSGAAAARNSGLDIARGEYIMFVDADDYIDARLCEKLLQNLEIYGGKCCLCGYQMLTEGNEKKRESISARQVVVLTGREAIRKRYMEGLDYINIINPWGKLFHWSMWKEIRFTAGLYYEDLDIMPYLYTRCDKLICIPYIGYYYLQRIGSCSHGVDTDDKRYIDSIKIRKKHILFFEEMGEKQLARAVVQKTLELIITSDCNNWIPNEYKDESCKLVQTYWRDIFSYNLVTKKDKIRYIIYRYFGDKLYKKIALFFSR